MKSVLLKGFISFAILLGICNAFLFILILPPIGGHYKLPSSSMAPTLNGGDHIYVSKFSYALSRHKIPSQGDIIIFKNGKQKKAFIKRVIGLPGDKVEMRKGRLYLNDRMVERRLDGEYKARWGLQGQVGVKLYSERLNTGTPSFLIFEKNDYGRFDNTGVFEVPAGHVFVLGDNRDNSMDSRSRQAGFSTYANDMGYVPVENIFGEVKRVLFPTKLCKIGGELYCPPRRIFKKL